MISRWLLLTLFVVGFTPRVLHAQPAPGDTRPTAVDAPNYDKMYEDIEIFRRILDRKLKPLYPTHAYETFGMAGMGGMQNMPGMSPMGGGMGAMQDGMGIGGGMMPVTFPIRSLEGVYLKGQGIVYTATLSSLQPTAKAQTNEWEKKEWKVVRLDSEWESVRRQLRPEKEEPKKPEASKPPTLTDVLLKELAENGHHFSQLGEKESLTIVLTVHETSTSSAVTNSSGEAATTITISEFTPATTGGGSDLRVQIRNLELLGEFHLKQAKYEEAIMVYHKLLELTKSPKQAAEVRRKLAQCYLLKGQVEKARTELDQAITLLKKADDKKKPAPAAKRAASPLPVKLIISAPKKLLDQVKEGKITFEEFRQTARVEKIGSDNSPR